MCELALWTVGLTQTASLHVNASLAVLQKAVQEAADELNKQKEALQACNEVWYLLAFICLRSYRPGGGHFRNFRVGMCRGHPRTLEPLAYTRASSSEFCYP